MEVVFFFFFSFIHVCWKCLTFSTHTGSDDTTVTHPLIYSPLDRMSCSFMGIKRDDCWKWTCDFPLLFVIVTWFTMMIYHFLFVPENYQNCQLLTENYGLFWLFFAFLFFSPTLPLSLFSTHLVGRRGIYFHNHTYLLPCLFGLWRYEFLLETCSVF